MLRLLETENDGSIPAIELKDGQVAIITECNAEGNLGPIVQRCGNNLITLGGERNNAWYGLFCDPSTINCRVRILPPGTKLVV